MKTYLVIYWVFWSGTAFGNVSYTLKSWMTSDIDTKLTCEAMGFDLIRNLKTPVTSTVQYLGFTYACEVR